jgi:hypothetical protein
MCFILGDSDGCKCFNILMHKKIQHVTSNITCKPKSIVSNIELGKMTALVEKLTSSSMDELLTELMLGFTLVTIVELSKIGHIGR